MKIPSWLYSHQLILCAIGLAYLILFAFPVATQGIENIRMIEAFSVDEAHLVRYIRDAIEQQRFGVIMHNYGYLYFYLGVAPLMLLNNFSPVTDTEIAIVFRMLSAIFFLGSVAMTYLLGVYVFNRRIALVATAFMLVGSGLMYDASMTIHPNTSQLFFMLTGFYFLYRFYFQKNPRDIMLAAAMSGFAFSCNYSGILLVPFVIGAFLVQKRSYSMVTVKNWWAIWGYIFFILFFINPFFLKDYFLPNIIGYIVKILVTILFIVTVIYALYRVSHFLISQQIWGNKFIRKMDFLYLIGFIFWGAFVFSSPGAVYELNFIDSFQKVIGLANVSELNVHYPEFGKWMRNLIEIEYLGGAVMPVLAIWSFPVIWYYRKSLLPSYFPIWIWLVFFFTAIVVLIKPEYILYMLPLIPFLLLLAVFTAEFLISKYGLKWPILFPLSVALIMITSIYFFGKRKTQYQRYMNKENDPRLVVGDWVSSNYRGDTKILSDQYVYLPPKMREVDFAWGFTRQQLDSADVVIINMKLIKNYLTENFEMRTDLHPEEKDIARNYARILWETPPWRKHYHWGDINVYTKNK